MRVVVTGIGVVSPLGIGIREAWTALLRKDVGIVHLGEDYKELPSQVGGRVKGWEPAKFIDKKELRRMPLFAQYALAASKLALDDASYVPKDDNALRRTGVAIGSGIGGFDAAYENSVNYFNGGYRKVQPLFVPNLLSNMAAGHVSIATGFRGPNHSVATACTTGAHAIGDAYHFIKLGKADAMLAGSTEAAIHPLSVAGFARARSLATKYNDQPHLASRPFDQSRDGFVIGEGSAVLLLESEEHAKKRGAEIYATVDGYGLSGDANHITAPHPEGRGAYECMEAALSDSPNAQVRYVNAHATSTPLGDAIEASAIHRLFGDKTAVSSTKGATGHLLGAAGSLEAAFTIMALKSQTLPPSVNLEEPDENCKCCNFVTEASDADIPQALSNSFGFGGTNASLLFGRA